MKRLGIVGLEHFHVTGWVESLELFPDQIDIVAIYDPDPKRGELLAPTHHDPHLSPSLKPSYRNLPFTTDLDELIRDQQLDMALVTMPNATTPDVIARLARANIHMLLDKPTARTAAEAEAAFAVVRASDVKVAVGLTRRYGQSWRDARDLVTSGRLGRLFTAEAIFTTSSVKVRDPSNQIFSRELSGGGVLHWLGVHDIDMLRWLTGQRVVEVQAMAGTVNGEAIDVEDAISVALRFESGAIGTVHYAYALPRVGSDGYVALRGSGGSVKVTPDGKVIWIGAGDISDPITTQETVYSSAPFQGYGSGGAAIVADLLDAIDNDRQPLVTGEDAIEALKIIDAAYESARTGQRIRLG